MSKKVNSNYFQHFYAVQKKAIREKWQIKNTKRNLP